MNTTREQKKQKALEIMKKMDIFKPYIKGFKDEDLVCFFERCCGYWAYQEPALMDRIKEIEQRFDCLVYAVTHEYTEFGELWDLLIISDYEEDWDDIVIKVDTNKFYAFASVWNVSHDTLSEFGFIGVQSFGGGIARYC